MRPSRFSQYNADEVVRQYRQRAWIGKGIVIAIFIALIVLISTHVLPTFGGMIPVYVVILITACGIYASYEIALKKEIRKILFHDCDPQKYLEVTQAFVKDGVTNDKNSALHLESAKAYAYLRDYTKMKRELDQVFFKKWKWKRELDRVHLNGWYAIDRYEHNEFQSAQHELQRISENINLNDQGARMVNQISTSWKIKRMAQKHDVKIRPLLSDLVRSYQISPINKVNYSLMLAELDVDAKELQNAEERFTYVIEHGNTSADVWYAKKELEQAIPQAKILHPQKKSVNKKKSKVTQKKNSSIPKVKITQSKEEHTKTTLSHSVNTNKQEEKSGQRGKDSTSVSVSQLGTSTQDKSLDVQHNHQATDLSQTTNEAMSMTVKNDLSAESIKAMAKEKNQQDMIKKEKSKKQEDFSFKIATEAQEDSPKE